MGHHGCYSRTTVLLLVQAAVVSVLSLASSPSLFPYQRIGVERLVRDRRVLLADEMGLGKTIQAISALNVLWGDGALRPDARVLVVCPKSVLSVWSEEIETWLDPNSDFDVRIATAGTSPEIESGVIQLINYDICHKHKILLQSAEFDVLICDEAHYLKSPDTKRTRAILGDDKGGGGIRSRYLWLLTGTPIMNRPVELHPLLRAIDRGGWEARSKYIERYCAPRRERWGLEAKGASNLGELSERLKPIMIRRYKSDVLADLPPKLRSCINLEGSDAARQERDMVAEMMGMGIMASDDWYGEDYDAVGDGFNLEAFGAEASSLSTYLPGVKLASLRDSNKLLGTLATIRKQTAMLKLRPAIQLLKDAMLSHKVVVFAHHRELIKELVAEFREAAVMVIGGMDSKSRSDAVRRFQCDDSIRLFVGSIRAAGVGVTLTASSHVVFLELDWSPAIMAQAEDRCHRVGQRDSVQVQYYVFKDTIDEWIARQLLSKQVDIDRVMQDSAVSETNGYTLDFGKHKGVRIEDLPQDYLSFIVDTDKGAIWRKRPELWRALARGGYVREEPPPPEKAATVNEASTDGSQNEDVAVDYVFDFGKHSGMEWDDVPLSYRDWILRNSVWRNRPKLKEALAAAGLVENGD